ncbi:MAG: aspartate ammonia-lyase, partial [Acidobacteria bacterium]
MAGEEYRVEKDTMGEVKVPVAALYGAQTQRAVDNFPISDLRFQPSFVRALGLIKRAAATVNRDLGLLEPDVAGAIERAAAEVESGLHDRQFPLDVFQTGSGTSTNMNANEVLATLASRALGRPVHANDQVNMSQSSNDVIPAAIHVSGCLAVTRELLPALAHLKAAIDRKASDVDSIVKTGRTHLMDALPITMGQELRAWGAQVQAGIERLEASLPRLAELALGATAIGTGLNAHPEFGERVARRLA